MKEIVIADIKNKAVKKLFETFFDKIQASLEIKDKNRSGYSLFTSDRNLRSIVENKKTLQSKPFDTFIKNLLALEKNPAYLGTTEWKILTNGLDQSLRDSLKPSVYKAALDYLKQSEFLGENNFSVIKVASVIYSLSQSDPLDAADMLVFLSNDELLTEENLGKVKFNDKLDIKLFISVIQKLSLNGGSEHLLIQSNLDKLLDNPNLDLAVLAKFIQAEAESKILTQEKFNLAIKYNYLKNLLTHENINKIEKIEIDHAQLAEILSLLDKAKILTQDNFIAIIGLGETVFLFKELSKRQLNQESFSNLLKIKTRDLIDGAKDLSANIVPPKTFLDTLIAFLNKIIAYLKDLLNIQNEKQAKVANNLGIGSRNAFYPSNTDKNKENYTKYIDHKGPQNSQLN